jgi:heme-degrading monooxygenase HmoA
MHARVTQVKVLPAKFDRFQRALESLLPKLRQQEGFRALVVLRSGTKAKPEATIVSVWDSLAEMKASEKNMFLYQALARIMEHCQGFPKITEEPVLIAEFAAD